MFIHINFNCINKGRNTHHQTDHRKEQEQHWQNHRMNYQYSTEEDFQSQEVEVSTAAWTVRRHLLLQT